MTTSRRRSTAERLSVDAVLTSWLLDALYFTVTVFATVGFGDIVATTQLARLVVTVQMILDLGVLGLGIRVFLGAVQRGRQQHTAQQETESP